jgi:hypothetical protein
MFNLMKISTTALAILGTQARKPINNQTPSTSSTNNSSTGNNRATNFPVNGSALVKSTVFQSYPHSGRRALDNSTYLQSHPNSDVKQLILKIDEGTLKLKDVDTEYREFGEGVLHSLGHKLCTYFFSKSNTEGIKFVDWAQRKQYLEFKFLLISAQKSANQEIIDYINSKHKMALNNNLKINNDVLEALSLEPDKRTDFIATHYVSTKYNTFDPRLISKDIAILIMTGKKDEAVLLTQTIIDNENLLRINAKNIINYVTRLATIHDDQTAYQFAVETLGAELNSEHQGESNEDLSITQFSNNIYNYIVNHKDFSPQKSNTDALTAVLTNNIDVLHSMIKSDKNLSEKYFGLSLLDIAILLKHGEMVKNLKKIIPNSIKNSKYNQEDISITHAMLYIAHHHENINSAYLNAIEVGDTKIANALETIGVDNGLYSIELSLNKVLSTAAINNKIGSEKTFDILLAKETDVQATYTNLIKSGESEAADRLASYYTQRTGTYLGY